jgi:hypothetical protein
MSRRRYLQAVTPPDDKVTGGRPKLYAYGLGFIAMRAGVSSRAVRRAVSSGKLDPTEPFSVVAYALDKRGHCEAARVVASQTPAAVAAREEQT